MRAYAEAKYHPQAMVDAHLALYDRVLATQARRRSDWLDPIVQLAIKAYWARRPRTAI
jgi:hypothetical protein